MIVYDDACVAVGLDPKEVVRIARGLEKYGLLAQELGLQVFGASTASLRCSVPFGDTEGTSPDSKSLLVADLIRGDFDGGDGATHLDSNNFFRGE